MRPGGAIGGAIRGALGLALALSLLAEPAAAWPNRIVSLNMCADQFVLMLADPANIVALSHFSKSAERSYMAEAAEPFPITHGRIEHILSLAPDLVLTGPFTTATVGAMLKRTGVATHEVPVVNSLAEIRTVTRATAAALGHPERGERLVAEMDRQLATLKPRPGARPLAAAFEANAIAVGGGTLIDDVLKVAGFDNMATKLGMTGYAYLPLEKLIAARPEFLVVGVVDRRYPSLGQQLLDHPALSRGVRPWRTVTVPGRLWVCGTPKVTEAVRLLTEARR